MGDYRSLYFCIGIACKYSTDWRKNLDGNYCSIFGSEKKSKTSILSIARES